jgi:EAL domain-containing protein (putative c-di-GMP-specific phosphodiesterase class I)
MTPLLITHEKELADYLAHAMAHNQLKLYAQHLVEVHTGKLVGAEVLLRVPQPHRLSLKNHSESTTLSSPINTEQWIEAASHHGLIEPLTEWLVRSVAEFLNKSASFIDIPLSINAPPSVLTSRFVKFLATMLKTHKVPTSLIMIEITETQKPLDLAALNEVINDLRAMGIKVIIDDFGSGYSTMTYLVDLSVDAVKIDRSFVQKAPNQSCAYSVLKSLIELAKEVGLQVICEGIENIEQFDLVKKLGCDIVQGYLINRPMPLGEALNENEDFSDQPLC